MKLERHKLHPLTKQQKRMAEENHNLIYGFIHRFGYSVEEHYNIIVFGYLRAIQIYSERKELQEKYDFPFIAWMYMRSEIGNHFRMENSKCRQAENGVVSFDANYAETENIYNTIGGKSAESDIMESATMEILLQDLSDVQKKIARLKVDGYSSKEIYLLLDIKQSTYYNEVTRIKQILKNTLIG